MKGKPLFISFLELPSEHGRTWVVVALDNVLGDWEFKIQWRDSNPQRIIRGHREFVNDCGKGKEMFRATTVTAVVFAAINDNAY
jgi:hypothetical protein